MNRATRLVRRVTSLVSRFWVDALILASTAGLLSIAASRHSAADALGLGEGDEVTLEPLEDDGEEGTASTRVALGQREGNGS